MEDDDDTGNGGEGLSMSIDQAAAAFAKSTANGAAQANPDPEDEQSEQAEDELQASDEDVSEETGDPDEEGQAEDEDEEEPGSDQGRFVASNGKVRLPDGTVSTVADLVAGNLRDRDYRQKTMAVAEEKRAFAEQSAAFEASKRQVDEQREYMARLLESITPPPPDPGMLQVDPIGYLNAKEHHDQYSKHLTYLREQMGMSKQQASAETQKQRQERANAEMERLREARPDLKDETKLKSFAEDIKSAGQAAGFSLQEIAEQVPFDHRMALVLAKAAKWDRLQANKPKTVSQVKERPPITKGGKRFSPDVAKAQRASDAITRLRKTGSHDDAVAAYLASKG
jgi:hypothetical protein